MCKKVTYTFAILLIVCCFSLAAASKNKQSPTYQQVLAKLENLKPGETIEVRMGTEKEWYNIEEPFEIRFLASKDSYFILMDISTNGDIRFLAPSRHILDPRIKGEKVYSTGLPSGPASDEEALYDFEMKMKAGPPGGTETINLFCSTEKIELFEADFDEKEPFYTIRHDNEERLKALLNRLDQLEQYEWSGSSVKIHIGQEPAMMPRKEGIGKKIPRRIESLPVPKSAKKMIPRRFGALPPIGSTGSTGKFFPPIGSAGSTGKTDKIDAP